MKSYDELLDQAQSLGLKVYERIPLEDGVRGMIYFKIIALSESLVTENDKRVVLAEEIAHFRKNTGNITDLKIHIHEELIAHKDVFEQIDFFEFLDSIINNGESANTYNSSQELGVPEWFFKHLYDFYSEMPFKPFVYRGCRVFFHPLNIIPVDEEFYVAS